MKQTRLLSEFSCLSEYTQLYPNDVEHSSEITLVTVHVQCSCSNLYLVENVYHIEQCIVHVISF